MNLPYPNYPTGGELRLICVLHEMCHTVGLEHEHSRPDRDSHIKITCETTNINFCSKNLIAFGHYDYYSIMHYGHGSGWTSKKRELCTVADTSHTFSAGDISVLRYLYGQGNRPHRAEWHNSCSSECSTTLCSCGACKPVGNLNCGYMGSVGHWSCCMNEQKESDCSTHSGFWHLACYDKRCTKTMCSCNSCGGGCDYIGTKAHWSCCGNDILDSVCFLNLNQEIMLKRIGFESCK